MWDRDELGAWLRLLESPGIGLDTARRLLLSLGSPQAVFDLPGAAWQDLLTSKQRESLSRPPEHLDAALDGTWAWLQANPSHQILLLGDADYPPQLMATPDPPLLLYLQGRRELLRSPCLAVVGSRNPTAQGRDNARAFARELAQAGLCITSGLALGVDGAAHQGALAAGGATIAVMGTGFDQIYPRRHQALAAQISEQGLILSEYTWGMPGLASNFPRRNRLIAGLSLGTLVVEAALPSGSLITARLASEAGREVFAIPGSIHSPMSRGCHALIRQGAKLVETAQDVLEELPPGSWPGSPAVNSSKQPSAPSEALDCSPAQRQVLELMGFDPIGLDALQARGGWPVAKLSAHLLELELSGAIARLPGQQFQRRAGA
ncbi:DNA-processing protein DprA [Kinneretia aquatilis]|uniref:DNA-processing protein DprA n=1 Tax=Kinneretia aquatilis TaxID=2070761 RepID=UPI001495141B|nr:DNA-processing protein DprA [Paucibacter aquatile]WIV97356.1 DNA-processing protein DprA [Paucibacter aquatile]